jgi:hypothetical protein
MSPVVVGLTQDHYLLSGDLLVGYLYLWCNTSPSLPVAYQLSSYLVSLPMDNVGRTDRMMQLNQSSESVALIPGRCNHSQSVHQFESVLDLFESNYLA